ncbi:hypothetical protein LJC08_06155 [Methanimicrococcus sp. OttesenSCG-928-J09]|nr:hypothetical protein [Methanimicrococcus sp. OttesenSCG-928-J09]
MYNCPTGFFGDAPRARIAPFLKKEIKEERREKEEKKKKRELKEKERKKRKRGKKGKLFFKSGKTMPSFFFNS